MENTHDAKDWQQELINSEEIILELQFGEGGEDSKLFVTNLFSAYCKYAKINNLRGELLYESNGHIIAKFIGDKAGSYFQHESGTHCIQRIPPTETKGRKQTSFVSVAVLPIKKEYEYALIPRDELEIITQTGHGKGGQHQNKTASAVRIKHLPTGLTVFINGRDQHANKREALKIITARVNDKSKIEHDSKYAEWRKNTLGDGSRGSKIRTYNFLESRAVDHRFNLKTSNVRGVIEKGQFDLILPRR